MNDDVEEFYINSISNQSRCTSFTEVHDGFLGSRRHHLAEISDIGLYRIRDAIVQHRDPVRSILEI